MFFMIVRDGQFLTAAGGWAEEERLARRFGSYEKAKAACDKLADAAAHVMQRMAAPS
jgi:hypothetical protein